jgi:ROK family protein
MAPAPAASLTRGDRLGYFMRGMIAGIDLGGTQVRVALARSDGQIVFSARTRTALLGGPERLVEWVAEQIGRRDTGEPLRGPAFGTPGPIDKKNGVLVNPPNLPGWTDVPKVAPAFMSVLRGSPFIKPGRRPRVRRDQLGDRADQVGAVEWARTHP